MRDTSHHIHTIIMAPQGSLSHSSKRVGAFRLCFLSVLLFGCLLLLSACNGLFGTNASHLNTLVVRRPASIDASLRAEGKLQLESFQQWVGLLQQYNGQTDTYGQELLSDRHALNKAKTTTDYRQALQNLQQHAASIQIPALKNEANYQYQLLTRQAQDWGKAHTYHNNYNGITYHMGYEYGPDGMAGWVQDEMSNAKTIADYQQAVKDANISLAHFLAYQTNASDSTPWNHPHQTDLQLMQRYRTQDQRVVVISLGEQTMRLYDKGKLVKAIHITTGRPEKPSLPGFWTVESKQSPTVFKSDQPRGSPYWYPDTPIHYAMLYHSGGYFLHDSWWRADYGPNTQFPHYDSSGDSFSFDGSHGCVNIATSEAAWVYEFVDLHTPVIIY